VLLLLLDYSFVWTISIHARHRYINWTTIIFITAVIIVIASFLDSSVIIRFRTLFESYCPLIQWSAPLVISRQTTTVIKVTVIFVIIVIGVTIILIYLKGAVSLFLLFFLLDLIHHPISYNFISCASISCGLVAVRCYLWWMAVLSIHLLKLRLGSIGWSVICY